MATCAVGLEECFTILGLTDEKESNAIRKVPTRRIVRNEDQWFMFSIGGAGATCSQLTGSVDDGRQAPTVI